MNIIELLESKLLSLPREREEDNYEKFIENWFSEYLAAIQGLKSHDWATQQLKELHKVLADLCGHIRSALDLYFNGAPSQAYTNLKLGLEMLLPWIPNLGTTDDVSQYLKYLYRLRIGSLADYKRYDLFHIPFEKRYLVAPQRYSILGSPSLYLGGSIWICWEELARPAFEQIQVSRFRAIPNSNIRVLDFAYRPAAMARFARYMEADLLQKTSNAEFVLSYSVCWPLIAACSVRVRHPGSPFVPEYIIPQLLLQWIRDGDHFEGIRYFSTKVAHFEDGLDADAVQAAAGAAANYVFPSVQRQPTGHCKRLTSQFRLSTPMAWSIVHNTDMIEDPQSVPPGWFLRLNEDVGTSYSKTSFYRCERKISGLPCLSV